MKPWILSFVWRWYLWHLKQISLKRSYFSCTQSQKRRSSEMLKSGKDSSTSFLLLLKRYRLGTNSSYTCRLAHRSRTSRKLEKSGIYKEKDIHQSRICIIIRFSSKRHTLNQTLKWTGKEYSELSLRGHSLTGHLSKPDRVTLGTKATVWFREVSALERVQLQRYKCNSAGSGPNLLSSLERCPV